MITSQNAAGSVCPKGWKLPSSGDNTTKGTFGYTLSQYGVQSSLQANSSVNGNTYNIALSPLFGVRGGVVVAGNTTIPFQYAGNGGRYWSSRASSNTSNAYALYFDTSVYLSLSTNRYFGYSLRCLIPTP